MIIKIIQQPWLSNIIVMKMIIIIIQPWLSNIIAMIIIIINQPCSPQLASDCLFLSLAPSEANKERLSQGESGDGDGNEWWLSQWLQRWLWLVLNLVYVCGKEAGGRWRGHTPGGETIITVTSPSESSSVIIITTIIIFIIRLVGTGQPHHHGDVTLKVIIIILKHESYHSFHHHLHGNQHPNPRHSHQPVAIWGSWLLIFLYLLQITFLMKKK